MILNSDAQNFLTSYMIKDKGFLDQFIKSDMQKGSNIDSLISKEVFISNFNDFFGHDLLLPDQDYAFFLFLDAVSNIKIFEKTLEINTLPRQSEQNCPPSYVHIVTLSPEMIKVGLDGVLPKNLNLVFISNPDCVTEKVNIIEITKEASLSFVFLVLSNYFQDVLFSLLNNKDVLDLVKYVQLPKDQKFVDMENFFATFRSDHFLPISEDWVSFLSNQRIKRFLIKDFEDESFKTRKWLEKATRKYESRFSSSILGGLRCRYFLIFPEYLMLSLLSILWLIYLVSSMIGLVRSKKFIKICVKLYTLSGFFHKSFMSSLLLIYFYNVTAFCSVVKLLTSLNFGAVEFVILVVRGGFITYPWIQLAKRLFEVQRAIRKKILIKTVAKVLSNPIKKCL